jgi:valyl-tRNA synthetase
LCEHALGREISCKAKVFVATKYTESFEGADAFFKRLASASEIAVAESFGADVLSADDAVQIVTDSATLYLPMADLIDLEKEKARLAAELARLDGEIERANKKLSNESFTAKAPAAVVEGERAKLQKYIENRQGVAEALAKLK